MVPVLFLVISLVLKQGACLAATEAEKAHPVLGKVPAILAEEEALLTSYGAAFRKAGEKYGGKVLQNLEVLPHGLHHMKSFVSWMMTRFPERDYKDLFADQDRFIQVPVLRSRCLDRIGTYIEEMLKRRRTVAERYGDLFLVLGKDPERLALRAQADEHMRQNQDKPKTAFIDAMTTFEGEEIAQARWNLVQAQKAKKMMDHNLEALGVTGISKEIEGQLVLLKKSPLKKMSLMKLAFYRDAFVYFYKKDITAFLDPHTGVEDLWKHLRSRKEAGGFDRVEIEGESNGGVVLYQFLSAQRGEYRALFGKLTEWLEDIREGRAEDPKRGILRQLVDKERTLVLTGALEALEAEGKGRIHFIIKKEAELIAKAPVMDQMPAELQGAITEAEADLDRAYEDAMKAWTTFKKGPTVLALGWEK
jgi:hypothetical protein